MRKMLYFDVEWANSKNKSICQLGLLSQDFDTGDPIYPELNIYVNPQDKFDNICISVHNITKAKVKDCKPFNIIWKDINKYFTNSIVVGHNVRSADLNALVHNLKRYSLDIPEMWYIDTYELARLVVHPSLVDNYKLSTLCSYFCINIENAHDAFDDACACSDLLEVLVDTYDLDLDQYIKKYNPSEVKNFIPFVSTVECRREINTLFGVISGIEADKVINSKEVNYLKSWRDTHQEYKYYDSVSFVIEVLDDILSDNIITFNELSYLKSKIVIYIQMINSSKETLATQHLQGLVNGIACDEYIKEIEVRKLQEWLYQNDYLDGHYPYNKMVSLVNTILEDNIITNSEQQQLVKLFKELSNPLEEIKEMVIEFSGKSFVLSGNFKYGSKKSVEDYIISKGGTIDKSVKKTTAYVVVGASGSDKYSNGNYGTKVKKALELNIPVLKEQQLF